MELFAAVELFTQVITYIMIMAGLPSCFDMVRNKSAENAPWEFFLVGFANGVLSLGYGFLMDNSTFIQINSIATFFNIIYILSYLYATRMKGAATNQLLTCVFLLIGVYLYLTRLVEPHQAVDRIGPILLVVSTVMLLTPFVQVKRCLDDRSAACLSMALLVAGTLCCGAWAMYGYLLKDVYIYGPNVVGLTPLVCQWAALVTFGTRPSNKQHAE